MPEIGPSDFSANLFWDADPACLDLERHQSYVVRRVLERGSWDDWCLLRRHLGLARIVQVAQALRTLEPKALAFVSVVASIPRESFQCYTPKQSMPSSWVY
jgi:hypothetical protein